jgi:hypothetical protein
MKDMLLMKKAGTIYSESHDRNHRIYLGIIMKHVSFLVTYSRVQYHAAADVVLFALS